MLLDAILENPESIWMSSRAVKVDHFSRRGIATDDCPHLTVRKDIKELDEAFGRALECRLFFLPESLVFCDPFA